jgi:glycosyl transferase family 25
LPSKPPKVNVINLDRDGDRWTAVFDELTSAGVPAGAIQRFPAVHGKNLTRMELEADCTALARRFCTPGMLGCFLSHRNLWLKILREPEPYQMVLEDDVIPVSDFPTRVQQCLEELQRHPQTAETWDVLLLGAFSCVHPDQRYGMFRVQAILLGDGRKPRFVTPHCHVPHRPLGTFGYILTKRGARKLLQRAYKPGWHVDCVAWSDPALELYMAHPMLVHQDMTTGSTVGSATTGLETLLPNREIDSYTKISIAWSLNEAFIQLGPVTISVGRYLTYTFAGLVVGILFRNALPVWFLPLHMSMAVGIALLIVRLLTSTAEGIDEGTLEELTG